MPLHPHPNPPPFKGEGNLIRGFLGTRREDVLDQDTHIRCVLVNFRLSRRAAGGFHRRIPAGHATDNLTARHRHEANDLLRFLAELVALGFEGERMKNGCLELGIVRAAAQQRAQFIFVFLAEAQV